MDRGWQYKLLSVALVDALRKDLSDPETAEMLKSLRFAFNDMVHPWNVLDEATNGVKSPTILPKGVIEGIVLTFAFSHTKPY